MLRELARKGRALFRRPVKTLGPRAAYALWASSYPARAHNLVMQAEEAALLNCLAALRPASALDLGTGSGRWLSHLARTGAARLAGADLSLPMLRRNQAGFPLLAADALALPFAAEVFGLVLASLMVGHVPDLPSFAREARRVLRPGGSLLYSDFHPDGARLGWQRTFRAPDGRVYAVEHYARSLAEHRQALEGAGFEVRETNEVRLTTRADPQARAFRRRWGDAAVAVVYLAVAA